MGGGVLDVTEWHAGIEGSREERVAQRVRAGSLRDPGALGQPPHRPSSGVPGQALAVVAEEDRPVEPLTDRQIEGPGSAWCEGDGDGLAALAMHHQGAAAPVEAELVDVGTERLGVPQTVQRQQRTQHMILRRRQSGLNKERAPSSLRSRPTACDS